MGQYTLTGEDNLLLNDIPLMVDTSKGDVVTLDFPNDIMTMETGKNKNTIYALNEEGGNVNLTIKLQRGTAGHKFLNGLQSQQDRDFVGFPLMNGAFVKRLGDGQGNVTYNTFNLQGLMFSKKPGTKANTDGDTEQGSVTYILKGALATESMV